jgi:DNA processing protein
MTDREAYIALNLIDQLGPVRVRALVAHLGSLPAIFEADEAALRGAEGIGRDLAAAIVAGRGAADPAAEEARARAVSARLVTPVDPDYPAALLKIHDPPLALYVAGDLTPRDRQCMAVVGSRRCTQYGRSVADRLGFQLAKAGFTVVSGLARGIDIAAHEGALKAGGRTIAVLGGALDKLYPAEARPLADRIAKQGAVISEYTLGREPDRTTFPYRNRVISGLSMGVVVVEADRKSGAMITADQAGEQGRQVFAVPGRIDTPSSRGTHHLIRQGAKLVEDVRDILEEFEYLIPPSPRGGDGAAAEAGTEAAATPAFVFGDEERRIVEALAEGELDIDTLSRRAAVPVAKLGAMLIGLEMKRVVRMLPGRRAVLTVTLPRKETEGK